MSEQKTCTASGLRGEWRNGEGSIDRKQPVDSHWRTAPGTGRRFDLSNVRAPTYNSLKGWERSMPCGFLNLTSQDPFLDRAIHFFSTQSIPFTLQPLTHCQLFDLAKDYAEPWNPPSYYVLFFLPDLLNFNIFCD